MKVLQVVGSNYRVGTGIYSIINPLVEKLNEIGIETNVLYVGNELLENSLPLIYWYGKNFTASDFANYSLVIFHGIYYIDFISISHILQSQKIKYLIKPHSSLVKSSFRKKSLRKFAYLIIFNNFFKKSAGIVFTNEEERANSFAFLNRNYFIEMNGIYLKPKILKIQKENPDILQLFFLSRIDFSHKGVDILLDGISKIKDFLEKENCFISFYGNGLEKDFSYFQRRLTEINSKNISFKGALFGAEKEKMYVSSDIMLLTSRYEGFPTVLSEAMMYGIPSVLTRGTNGKFISESNAGWFSKSLKPSDVASTIKTAIIEYKCNFSYYRENARKLAEKTFDIDKTVEKTILMYKSVVDNVERLS